MTNTPIEDTFDNREEYNYILSLFNDIDKITKAEIQYKQHHPEEYIDIITNNVKDIRDIVNKKTINIPRYLLSLNCRIEYMCSGSTGHFYKIIQYDEHKNKICQFGMKLTMYNKTTLTGSIYDSTRPENVEIRISKLLGQYVLNGEIPHIILPFNTFYTDIKPFISLQCSGDNANVNDPKGRYKRFIISAKQGMYAPIVSINFYEYANNGDFLNFLKQNYNKLTLLEWKVFMFQILSTLAVIQSHYPGFKHNDLKANNILIHKVKKTDKKIKYKICGKNFMTPNIGYMLKLCDFDFASIRDIKQNVINQKVETPWAKKNGITSEKNLYYDVHYFFNSLIKGGFVEQIMTDPAVPQEFVDFINRIVPPNLRSSKYCNENGRLIQNIEFMSPQGILFSDAFFKSFKA